MAASINDALGLKVEVVVKHTRRTGHHGAGVLTWGMEDGRCDLNLQNTKVERTTTTFEF